jgi:hypothetical protein
MTTTPSKKRSRRSFVQSALAGLGAIPLVAVDTNAQSSTPQEERQSSPIIVGGGGSIGIYYSEFRFTADAQQKLVKADDYLHKLWLLDKYGALEDITPRNADCEITVFCGKSKGENVVIKIYGKPYGLWFDPKQFKLGYPPGGAKKIHHHKRRKIRKILVHDNVDKTDRWFDPPPTKGKCTLCVLNTY